MDSFFANGGTVTDLYSKGVPLAEFHKILKQTGASTSMSEMLRYFDEHYAVIIDPPAILDLGSIKLIDSFKFVNLITANKQITQINAQGEPKIVQAAPIWLRSPSRREHGQMVYEPGQAKVLLNGDYNVWQPGCEPRPGDVTPWLKLMERIFRDKPSFMRVWFERWCAYPLQNPGAKMFSAVVAFGETQGSGKSLTGEMVAGCYGMNAAEIDKTSLSSQFNSWSAKKQFILANEIADRKDLRLDAEKLKNMISRLSVEINGKYQPTYVVRDTCNYYFTSNHYAAIYADDEDRRYFPFHVEGKLPKEISASLREWHNKPRGKFENNEGFGSLLHYFLNLELGDFDPSVAPPHTADRELVIDAGRSDLDTWCQDLKADPMPFLRHGAEGFTPRDLWSIDELVHAYRVHCGHDASQKALVNALRKAGFTQLDCRVRTARGRLRVWVIENIERWGSASEIEVAESYNSTQPKGPKY